MSRGPGEAHVTSVTARDRPSRITRRAIMTRIKLLFVPLLGAALIRLLGKTIRIESRGYEFVDERYRQGRAIIIVFWHGRQLMMPLAYRGKEAHILISQHRDGELIQRIVARFGFRAIRGSSTRGGVAALRQLIRLGREGKDLVVTPDGPKGPRQVVQMGVIHLARTTGLPIVPLAFGCSKKKSSEAGIALSFHSRRVEVCSCGVIPCGCRPTARRRRWKASGRSSRSCSIASRRTPINSLQVIPHSSHGRLITKGAGESALFPIVTLHG